MPDGVVGERVKARRRERDGDRAAVEEPARRGLRIDVPGRRAVLGAEHDRLGIELEREVAQAVRRRGAQDDMRRDVRPAERLGAGVEQFLCVSLGEPLCRPLALHRMPHIREGDARTGCREHLPEREGVAVVVGSVVRNDDLRGH